MKHFGLPLFLILAILFACSDVHEPFLISDCMTQKIEEFKSQPIALAVIQIDAPFRKLYWFRFDGIPIDVGEDVYTGDCEWYCNFGCYCAPSAYCDEDLLRFPMDTIWRR